MGNRLFQEARRLVEQTKNVEPVDQQQRIISAQNALSSAFANATRAEQAQLSEMQMDLDELK
ncbi:DUF3813 domain-containing protein [Cytobacillus solani]|uniref:DUF3813 domain-containing protein n=1 Tax=Cytobacillus solani TaxID=1637975 RepID=A0A0Q3VGC8_9BACI|nr:DUF3813 domain-containing protein [Cytobacillus solani]KOP81700.1 hypothetical protein AMS60_03920 [Bacillus sp. FJAT-21945]KQL18639.1 hypothetical protein AN957_08685 [Cytobacillus solani]USK56620.1 DUF3813 domain-containing protein [Cytobacillus solani]